MHTKINQHGFIALISAIIISAILLLVATAGSMTGFTTRVNILNAEYKERSSALAAACIDHVLLMLSQDYNYPTGYTLPEAVTTPGGNCSVRASSGSSPRTFKLQGVYQNAYTDLLISVDPNTPAILSYQELAHF